MVFSFRADNKKGEIASIGLMRGLASILVCLFHFTNGNRRLLPDTNVLRTTGWWFHSGVEIFFIISGFIIPYSMYVNNYSISDIGIFFKKRIIRIEPPYLISIIIVLVTGYVGSMMPFYRGAPFYVDWLNVAGHVAYLNVFTGARWLQDLYWTLAVEFQYYILIAVVFNLVASKKIRIRLLFFLLLIALLTLRFLYPNSIFGFVSYFMMGIVLFQYYCRISSLFEFIMMLLVAATATFYVHGIILEFISLTTVAMIMFVKRVHPVFTFLGTISYSLYLIHAPFGGRIINLAEAYIRSVHVKELMVFVAFAFSLFAAYLYYIWVEKWFKGLAAKINYTKKIIPSNSDLS